MSWKRCPTACPRTPPPDGPRSRSPHAVAPVGPRPCELAVGKCENMGMAHPPRPGPPSGSDAAPTQRSGSIPSCFPCHLCPWGGGRGVGWRRASRGSTGLPEACSGPLGGDSQRSLQGVWALTLAFRPVAQQQPLRVVGSGPGVVSPTVFLRLPQPLPPSWFYLPGMRSFRSSWCPTAGSTCSDPHVCPHSCLPAHTCDSFVQAPCRGAGERASWIVLPQRAWSPPAHAPSWAR